MRYLDYLERVQHGTADFPIAYYYVDWQHPRYHMPLHWHRETELLHVAKGRLRLFVDDREHTLNAGDLLFIGEGVVHGGTPESCVYECVVFDIKALLMQTEPCKQALKNALTRNICLTDAVIRGDAALTAAVKNLMLSAQGEGPGGEMRLLGALFTFFGLLTEKKYDVLYGDARGASQQKSGQLKAALEYIESHYGQHIALETLARLTGMSAKYFCRYFRDIVHRTPIDYLNFYRVERACFSLSTTDMTVAEIAYQCGFSDSSFFIRQFKKYKGLTPRQYRLGGKS